MARTDWAKLQADFLAAHSDTGISAQAWCEQQGLNYQSARRYIKPRAAQETAQNCATAQSEVRTAQTAQNNGRVRNGKSSERDEESFSSTQLPKRPDKNGKNKLGSGRDSSGRFVEGHRESVGNSGNPNPPCNIKPGMQIAKTHGGYAKFLNADPLFDATRGMQLRDELEFTRARVLSVTEVLSRLREDLDQCEEISQRIEIYKSITSAEQALDRNIGRIESIERSLRAIKVDEARIPHIIADTERVQAATRKLTAEADRLETESGGDTTALGEVVEELQADGTGGLML